MTTEDDAIQALQNWGCWLRAQPNPFKHLRIGPQSIYKMMRNAGDSMRVTEVFDTDQAIATDDLVRKLQLERWQVYLYAYYGQCQSMLGLSQLFKENRRLTEKKMSGAQNAFIMLYFMQKDKKSA